MGFQPKEQVRLTNSGERALEVLFASRGNAENTNHALRMSGSRSKRKAVLCCLVTDQAVTTYGEVNVSARDEDE
jgi:hypothetical protein